MKQTRLLSEFSCLSEYIRLYHICNVCQYHCKIGPKVIQLFFTVSSNEHKISTAHKTKMLKNNEFSCFQTLICCIYHVDKW